MNAFEQKKQRNFSNSIMFAELNNIFQQHFQAQIRYINSENWKIYLFAYCATSFRSFFVWNVTAIQSPALDSCEWKIHEKHFIHYTIQFLCSWVLFFFLCYLYCLTSISRARGVCCFSWVFFSYGIWHQKITMLCNSSHLFVTRIWYKLHSWEVLLLSFCIISTESFSTFIQLI